MQKDEVARRRAIRRRKARKKHLVTGFIVFLIFGVSIFIALSFTLLFPVKNAKFSGSNIYSEKELSQSITVKGKNIFTISESKLLKSARKKLPYIDSVKINRQFPDTVSVTVTDAKEYAAYAVKGKYYIVNEEGYVLSQKSKKPKNTIEIRAKSLKFTLGEQVDYPKESIKETLDTIITALNAKKIKIDYIDLSMQSKITVGIMNKRFNVNFGTRQNLDKKVDHLAAMIKKMDSKAKGTINLSVWSETDPTGILVKE